MSGLRILEIMFFNVLAASLCGVKVKVIESHVYGYNKTEFLHRPNQTKSESQLNEIKLNQLLLLFFFIIIFYCSK